MEDLLQVGVITTTHGVRGEVKVFPTTDDPARFKKLKNVILDTGKEKLELEIAGVKFFKNMVILKFKGIDDINDVEKYRKKSLYVTRENAVKLKKDEYFIADLIGMKVSTDEGEELGTLSDVMQTQLELQFYEEGVLPLCKSVCADGPLLAERLLGQSVLESGFQGYYSGKTQALLGGTVWGTVQQNRAGTDASLSAGRIYPADRRCGRGKNFR